MPAIINRKVSLTQVAMLSVVDFHNSGFAYLSHSVSFIQVITSLIASLHFQRCILNYI